MSNALDPMAVKVSERFRKVSNRYPLRVAETYDGDIQRAMADTDERGAANVAAWGREQGLEPRDWPGIGEEEEGRGAV